MCVIPAADFWDMLRNLRHPSLIYVKIYWKGPVFFIVFNAFKV
jgi:hypothetical protein